MSVDVFDPAAAGGAGGSLADADLARLLEASHQLEAPEFGLSELEIARLGPLLRQGAADWQSLAQERPVAEVEALIRLLVLAEAQFRGWESGADSPVIPLARALKASGTYPSGLTRWIRANSSNRFLPYGSLLDRL